MKVTSRLLRNFLGSRRPTDLAHVDVLAISGVGLCEPGWQVVFRSPPGVEQPADVHQLARGSVRFGRIGLYCCRIHKAFYSLGSMKIFRHPAVDHFANRAGSANQVRTLFPATKKLG